MTKKTITKFILMLILLNIPTIRMNFSPSPDVFPLRDHHQGEVISPNLEIPQTASGISWELNGTAICTATGDQIHPQLCSDGAGGVIITWADDRFGYEFQDIYAQRINSTGIPQWTVNGIAICTASTQGSPYQRKPQLCSDGAGGAIITWDDDRGDGDIYAQKINSAGITQWTSNGTAICTASESQGSPQLCSDGAGGAIITWFDNRNEDGIYAQKINSAEITQWTANGTAICTVSEQKFSPQLCSDGAGGAIITWFDNRLGHNCRDIYAQRINSTGTPQWTTNGTAICTASESQGSPQLCSDSAGGAIITWVDDRRGYGFQDIYAQKINSTGTPQWTTNGTAICTACTQGTANQIVPQLCSDGAGGAIITWEDYRDGAGDIYAQRINSIGTPQWAVNGITICTASESQGSPQLCNDDTGGAIITWNDGRVNEDIYAQKIDSTGTPQWAVNGTAICTAYGHQWYPQLCSDGEGGAIITWVDGSDVGIKDIYAQRIILAPKITINSPHISNNLYGFLAPSFTITLSEDDFDKMWYSIDGEVTNFPFITNGTINQTAWDLQPNGTVTIEFFANDTIYGNIGSAEIVVYKDIVGPEIGINFPTENDIFGENPPDFSLSINEANLNKTWYTLDDGVSNHSFTGLTGDINESAWNAVSNGEITLRFYANDSMGNIGFHEVLIEKDDTHHILSIISPDSNEYFETVPPYLNGTILESNIDKIWYTLNDGIPTFINSIPPILPIQIDKNLWDAQSDGTIMIKIYANDTAGNEQVETISVYKDTLSPEITILTPLESEELGDANSPTYQIIIDEVNLDEFWYTLDNGVTNISITELSGSLNLEIWNTAAYGVVKITFYAKDLAGNIGSQEVAIIKVVTEPEKSFWEKILTEGIIIPVIGGIAAGAVGLIFWGIKKKKSKT